MNLDPKLIERAITSKTKAVMPVHLYGQPFDIDPILAICKKHKLPLVEDSAQAHAAKYKGKSIGTFGEISCFSFYPGKNLGASRRRRRARHKQCGIRQTRAFIARTRLDRALLSRRSRL